VVVACGKGASVRQDHGEDTAAGAGEGVRDIIILRDDRFGGHCVGSVPLRVWEFGCGVLLATVPLKRGSGELKVSSEYARGVVENDEAKSSYLS